jgi:hypothetical protein
MSYEFSGKLIEKYDEVVISDKFKKREFVLEKNDNGFIDTVKFQLVQNKTNLIDDFNPGDLLKVSFNIKGNKWKDNYFVNLQAWRIEKTDEITISAPPSKPPPPSLNDMPPEPGNPDDDLPF